MILVAFSWIITAFDIYFNTTIYLSICYIREYMTIQQRIEDIAKRYGKGSWQENEAIELAKQIEEYGLNEYDY